MLTRLFRSPVGQSPTPQEQCFYIDSTTPLSKEDMQRIEWLIREPRTVVTTKPTLIGRGIKEKGPRLNIETPSSSNAVAICNPMGLPVLRIEMSTLAASPILDRMTETFYPEPLTTFDTGVKPEPVRYIDILARGITALREANKTLGLGMDEWDLNYYTQIFQQLGRNPTDVELFQIGNANSEHSRHWFFRGTQVIDGVEMPESLMDIVKAPWIRNPNNSLVAFHDNAGVMHGVPVFMFAPLHPGEPSAFCVVKTLQHITATAETHNHPTLIAPFPGANTGAGGRIRDNRAVGRGGLVHMGFAGYCVGNLHIPGYKIPGEVVGGEKNNRTATPLEALLQGRNGVHDYGNKIGEPLTGGFTRSFGQTVGGARREFYKLVLYSAGLGSLDDAHYKKHDPEIGMIIVRIGGVARRIGVGGGSASSMIHGAQAEELDFKSVQRGDPEMENRVNRVIQACAEMGALNPIESIHDQGAGGPSNVLTELMEPLGGTVNIRKITLGDTTMSVLEIWSAEFQEGYGLLLRPKNFRRFRQICKRERVNCELLGGITGDGNVTVVDTSNKTTPVKLSLASILSAMPKKRFVSDHQTVELPPVVIPNGLQLAEATKMVFARLEVGSKGYLVHHVDRSVTGLVARQQCCGPTQVAVGDVAVKADGFFGKTGAAAAFGEQPVIMLIDPKKGARMAVAEMLTNLASAKISRLGDLKCRANWMFAAKLRGEGALLYDAAVSLRDIMLELGIAIDGGKDSLSMATSVNGESVVSPGQLVVMGYAPVPDITKVVTPDFKGNGKIGFIDLGLGKNRLGGSSLAQALGGIGTNAPDIDGDLLKRAFTAVQELIAKGLLTAYHDRSNGGLMTTIAEMCIAGNCGARFRVPFSALALPHLFSEEVGMVLGYQHEFEVRVRNVLKKHGVPFSCIGTTDSESRSLSIAHAGRTIFCEKISVLRGWWEETSLQLEALQANPATVAAERASHAESKTLQYHLSFVPQVPNISHQTLHRPKVAILREEGTNGDREMAAACYAAGLDPHDYTMSDLLDGRVTTFDNLRGLIFPGGFSFADVFGSAKGWAGPIRFNQTVREMFERFYKRDDTFSLGVCNGCQLMPQIGVSPWQGIPEEQQPRLVHNTSGEFESRWSWVKILESPSIMLRGMAGSTLGIHVAHGEGQFWFPDPRIADQVREQKLAPIVYVDADGQVTEVYPYNPNGSPEGWAALCSPDGRHLAMMPHPERCFRMWQWPHVPPEFRGLKVSPWLQMFQNATDWCHRG